MLETILETLPQQIVNGLAIGAIYALIALGYTMVYGVLGFINFAHGELFMIGAVVSTLLVGAMLTAELFRDGPSWMIIALVMLLVMSLCSSLGVTIERTAYRPLRNSGRLIPLISSLGVQILLQNGVMLTAGVRPMAMRELIPLHRFDLFGVYLTNRQIIAFLVALGLMALMVFLVQRTVLGISIRATAEDLEATSLMGVRTNTVIAWVFAIGGAMGAAGGCLFALNYGIAVWNMGFVAGLKAFTAAVLGGIGNIPGAMVGGIVLGLLEALGAGYLPLLTGGALGPEYRDIFAFIVLIAFLVLRPSGLLGKQLSKA